MTPWLQQDTGDRIGTAWLSWTVCVLFLSGCEPPEPEGAFSVQRDTLPTGVIHIRYSGLPESPGPPIEPDLVIGVLDGDPNEVLGDVRAVEADEDGAIYVLDHQTSEVRVFDSEGRHLWNITGRGEGPGELVAANGMVFSADGTLWIHDHGQWQMVGVTRDGREVGRVPIHVLTFGRFWSGGVDDAGRPWKPTSWPIGPRSTGAEVGLREGRSRRYISTYDPLRAVNDSVFLGTGVGGLFASDEGGFRYFPIPFEPRPQAIVDPAGGLWTFSGETYRLVRLHETGDTALVLDVDVDPQPVTAQDQERFVAEFLEAEPEGRAIAESLVRHARSFHPVIDQILVDDGGQLWVRRYSVDAQPRYDVFARDGSYVGSVELGFQSLRGLPPRVRDGSLYAVVADALGVQRVVRAPIGVAVGAR